MPYQSAKASEVTTICPKFTPAHPELLRLLESDAPDYIPARVKPDCKKEIWTWDYLHEANLVPPDLHIFKKHLLLFSTHQKKSLAILARGKFKTPGTHGQANHVLVKDLVGPSLGRG